MVKPAIQACGVCALGRHGETRHPGLRRVRIGGAMVKPAIQACGVSPFRPVAHCLPAALLPPVMSNLGDPQAANSRAPKGAGAGMGGKPMSADVLHVPDEVAHALRATAQGIVTRMGGRRPE